MSTQTATPFHNRMHAGELLAERLKVYQNVSNALVLALPRGGVPVAYPIAIQLHLPLDVFLVRKLGVPYHEEIALGAIAIGGLSIFNESIVNDFNISQEAIDAIKTKEQTELTRRVNMYRKDKPPLIVKNKTIILVDDGLATGATMKVAVAALESMEPERIIIAVPVAAFDVYQSLRAIVHDIICLKTPQHFSSVGEYYQDFSQTSDKEVITLLNRQH